MARRRLLRNGLFMLYPLRNRWIVPMMFGCLVIGIAVPANAVIQDAECGKQYTGTSWSDAAAEDYPNQLEHPLLVGIRSSSIGAGPSWICWDLVKQTNEDALIWTTHLDTSDVGASSLAEPGAGRCGTTNVYTNAFGGDWGLMASVGGTPSYSTTNIVCSWEVPYLWLSNGVDYKFENRHTSLRYNWEGDGDARSTTYDFTAKLTLEWDDIFTSSYSQFVCFRALPGGPCL